MTTQTNNPNRTPAVERGSQAFLDAIARAGGPPIYTLDPVAARAVLAGAQAFGTINARVTARFPATPAQLDH